jgi:hypothetical protein
MQIKKHKKRKQKMSLIPDFNIGRDSARDITVGLTCAATTLLITSNVAYRVSNRVIGRLVKTADVADKVASPTRKGKIIHAAVAGTVSALVNRFFSNRLDADTSTAIDVERAALERLLVAQQAAAEAAADN